MRRAMGPFLTTGVALVAAIVVVANPVTPASRDMQISTTQLSTSPGMLSPFDKSLLNAITPQFPPAGIGPALAQILAALAADADRISQEVNSQVAPEGSVAAATPDPVANHPGPTEGLSTESANATPVASTTGFAPATVSTEVQQALSGLVADTSYLGGKVVEAAYAAVDLIIRVPQYVITAVMALLNGNVGEVLDTVRSAIKDFFGPGLIILGGIVDILHNRFPPLPAAAGATGVAAADSTANATQTTSAEATPQQPVADPSAAGQPDPGPKLPGTSATGTSGRKHPAVTPANLRPTSTTPKSAADTEGNTAATPANTGGVAPSQVSPPVPQTGTSHVVGKPVAGSVRAGTTAGSARDLRPGAAAASATD